jgi:hypothetical protein
VRNRSNSEKNSIYFCKLRTRFQFSKKCHFLAIKLANQQKGIQNTFGRYNDSNEASSDSNLESAAR